MAYTPSKAIKVPKPDDWPGPVEAYKLVKPYIQPQIWNFVAAIAFGLAIAILVDLAFGTIFKNNPDTATFFGDLAGLVIGACIQSVVITMYFASLNNDEFTFNTALSYGLSRALKMLGLLIVMVVVLLVSFVLLIVPFLFILPRVYLAPYYFIYNDCKVSEAFAASWHSTKGNEVKVYGVVVIDILLTLLMVTIVGIPFAIYFGIINSASFALLVLHLSQPKKTKKVKAKTS